MGDVVYPRAAAAAIRAVHLLELQSRNRFQQIPWLLRTRWPWAR
jgi:hypothetical protein